MRKIVYVILILLFVSKISYSQKGSLKLYENKNAGLVITFSGLTFITASILEGGYDYGTWQTSYGPGNIQYNKYVIPPFMKQTPRQIMLFMGITLTITGVVHRITH